MRPENHLDINHLLQDAIIEAKSWLKEDVSQKRKKEILEFIKLLNTVLTKSYSVRP